MKDDSPLRYVVRLGGNLSPVRWVRGFERMNEPFRIEFSIPDADWLVAGDVVNSEMSLQLERPGVHTRVITGVATDVRSNATARGSRLAVVTLEPRLALTRLRQDIRVFRDKTVPQIVTEVLAHYGMKLDWRLAGSYPSYPYQVQFRETDFNFVSRLLQDEGIFYYFLEGDVTVFGDKPSSYQPLDGLASVPFRGGKGLDRDEEAVVVIGRKGKALAGKVTLRDFNPETPSADMDASAAGPWAGGPEYYDFPGEFLVQSEGARKAQLRADALKAASSGRHGSTVSHRFIPGGTFTLTNAPVSALDREYVVTEVVHQWDRDDEGFSLGFSVVHGDVAARPLMTAIPPRQPNPLTGYVTGPPGDDDIYTDEFGRVKVHFPWDRLQPKDDDCSHWVPIMQDNTGHSCSIPRIGWEVLCHFLEGDPDRPIVLGRVYNPHDPVHSQLPLLKTQSQIKSLSTPREKQRDSTGTNEIIIEDRATNEYVNIAAQKDQWVRVANDRRESVFGAETGQVRRDEAVSIGRDENITSGDNMTEHVNKDQTWSVGGDATTSAASAISNGVSGNHSLNIGGSSSSFVGLSDAIGTPILTEMVGGIILDAYKTGHFTEGRFGGILAVGGAIIDIAKLSKSGSYGKGRHELIGGLYLVKAGKEVQTRVDKIRMTTVGGMATISSVKEFSMRAVEKLHTDTLHTTITGEENLVLRVKECQVVIKDGTVSFNAPKTIKIKAQATNAQNTSKASLNDASPAPHKYSPSPAGPREKVAPEVVTKKYSDSITISGSPEYVQKVTEDLDKIAAQPKGKEILDKIAGSGHEVTIHDPNSSPKWQKAHKESGDHMDLYNARDYSNEGYEMKMDPDGDHAIIGAHGSPYRSLGKAGDGASGYIVYEPDGFPNDESPNTRSDHVLAHELSHAGRATTGTAMTGLAPADHGGWFRDAPKDGVDKDYTDDWHSIEEKMATDDENQYRKETGYGDYQRDNYTTIPLP